MKETLIEMLKKLVFFAGKEQENFQEIYKKYSDKIKRADRNEIIEAERFLEQIEINTIGGYDVEILLRELKEAC